MFIKCIKCHSILDIPDSAAGQECKCTCGYKFIAPDISKHRSLSQQATREKAASPLKAASTVSKVVQQKKSSGFGDSARLDDELREILLLQQGRESASAQSKLQALLCKQELNDYHSDRRGWELNVYFLRVYDKARVFYEREKDFKQAALYAAMAIFCRRVNLKQNDLGSTPDAKYINALKNNLKKLNANSAYQEINSAIVKFFRESPSPASRNALETAVESILNRLPESVPAAPSVAKEKKKASPKTSSPAPRKEPVVSIHEEPIVPARGKEIDPPPPQSRYYTGISRPEVPVAKVEAPSSYVFFCPHCKQKYEGGREYINAEIECHYCHRNFVLHPVKK